jgi:hypothetical protein
MECITKVHFIKGVRDNVQPQSRIPISSKIEINPILLINVEFYGLVLVPTLIK